MFFSRSTLATWILPLLLGLCTWSPSAWPTEQWVVIANDTVQLKTSRQVLIQVFMMQKLIDNQGHPLRPYSFVPEDERFLAFVSHCLHWPPQVMARRWRRSLTTGEGSTPHFVDTEDEMVHAVSNHDGALGYLPSNRLSEHEKRYKVIYRCKD